MADDQLPQDPTYENLLDQIQQGNVSFSNLASDQDPDRRMLARELQAYTQSRHGIDLSGGAQGEQNIQQKMMTPNTPQDYANAVQSGYQALGNAVAPLNSAATALHNAAASNIPLTGMNNPLMTALALTKPETNEEAGRDIFTAARNAPLGIGPVLNRAILSSNLSPTDTQGMVNAENASQSQFSNQNPVGSFAMKNLGLPAEIAGSGGLPTTILGGAAQQAIANPITAAGEQYEQTGKGTTPLQTAINTGAGAVEGAGNALLFNKLGPAVARFFSSPTEKAGNVLQGIPDMQNSLTQIRQIIANQLPNEAELAGGQGISDIYQKETNKLMSPEQKQAVSDLMDQDPAFARAMNKGIQNYNEKTGADISLEGDSTPKTITIGGKSFSTEDILNNHPVLKQAYEAATGKSLTPPTGPLGGDVPVGVIQEAQYAANPQRIAQEYDAAGNPANLPAKVKDLITNHFPDFAAANDAYSKQKMLQQITSQLPSKAVSPQFKSPGTGSLLTSLGNIKDALSAGPNTPAYQALSPYERDFIDRMPLNEEDLDKIIQGVQNYNNQQPVVNNALSSIMNNANNSSMLKRDIARGTAGVIGGSPHYAAFEAIKGAADALGKNPAAQSATRSAISNYVGGNPSSLLDLITQARAHQQLINSIGQTAAQTANAAEANSPMLHRITGGETQ